MNAIGFNSFIWIGKNLSDAALPDYSHFVKSNVSGLYFSRSNHSGVELFSLVDSLMTLNNSFTPLFLYKTSLIEILTSDFNFLVNLCKQCAIDFDGLREFILYNTPLGGRTFFKCVERVYNVACVSYDIGSESFIFVNDKVDDNSSSIALKDLFHERVGRIAEQCDNLHHAIFLSGGYESRINAAVASFFNLNATFITWGHPNDKEYIISDQIANYLTKEHINIRPDLKKLPYYEYALKTGFISNIQYAYRYQIVKLVKETLNADILWTGWGDINGMSLSKSPNELFTSWFLGQVNDRLSYPKGWNKNWLLSGSVSLFPFVIDKKRPTADILDINRNLFSPLIFGQVLALENSVIPVFAPWHHPTIFSAIGRMEKDDKRLVKSKYQRVLFKGSMYYKLLNQYDDHLNYIPLSKGFHPFWFSPKFGVLGPALAGLQSKLIRNHSCPFDPIEDLNFLKKELHEILDSNLEIFNQEEIIQILRNSNKWTGSDIMEIFKMIQIYWFFLLFCKK